MISERIPLKRTKLLKSVVHFWLFTTNAVIITIKLFVISSIEPQKRVDEEIDNSEYILYLISSISRYGVIKRKIPAIYRPTNETKQTSPENEQGGIKKRISRRHVAQRVFPPLSPLHPSNIEEDHTVTVKRRRSSRLSTPDVFAQISTWGP